MIVQGRHKSSAGVGLGGRSDLREYDQRLRRVMLLFLFFFLILIGRLVQIQIIEGEDYREIAFGNAIEERSIPAYRGSIFDSHGRIVAENRPSYDLTVIPGPLIDTEGGLELLTRHLALSIGEIARLTEAAELTPGRQLRLRRDLTRDQVALVETDQLRLPGVNVTAIPHRHYPYDDLAVHLLGYMSEVGPEQLERLRVSGYDEGDYVGRVALESSLEPILRGYDGYERSVVDVEGNVQTGEIAQRLLGDNHRFDPISGRNVLLTVDMELQEIVREAIDDYPTGAAVVIDPRDGSVLAMVSLPTYNPNAWTGRLSREEVLRDTTDETTPLFDRSIHAYFPGSVYKIVTAAAALEEGLIGPTDTLNCTGRYTCGTDEFVCNRRRGHGHITLAQALQQSCNVFFYTLGEQLGMERMLEYGHAFGFGEHPGSGLPNESSGLIPSTAWLEEHSPEGFQYGQVLNVSVGQGDTRVSPLQMGLAYAAIANGGDLYYPRLVDRIENGDGDTIFQYPSRLRRELPFSQEHIREIALGLTAAVNQEGGTAFDSSLSYVTVAGKTGTAQGTDTDLVVDENGVVTREETTSAWFSGFAPAEDPQIVVAVFLERGGAGGRNAAPVGVEIIDRYFREILDYETEISSALASGNTDDLEGLMRLNRPGTEDNSVIPFEAADRYLLGHQPERSVDRLIRQWREQR